MLYYMKLYYTKTRFKTSSAPSELLRNNALFLNFFEKVIENSQIV